MRNYGPDARKTNYAEGMSYGVQWAEQDLRNSMPTADEIARLREEAASDQRWARAFYLGALRGYREVTRTLRDGRWGT
jgi:hypothetical protein